MGITFLSNKWETAMTYQGHVTTASLKQVSKEYKKGHFFYPPASQKVLRIHP